MPFVGHSPDERVWRQATIMVLRFAALLVMLAVLISVSWWVWDYVVSNPMPYRDPEARNVVSIT